MTKEEIIKPENLVYKKPTLMNDNPMHYCPGCSHGVVHKLIAEVIEEMGMEDKTIGVSPVGCAVFAYNYLDIDWQEAAHGRVGLLILSAAEVCVRFAPTRWLHPLAPLKRLSPVYPPQREIRSAVFPFHRVL